MEAVEDGRPVPLPGGRVHTLLAVLLVHAEQVVTIPELTECLWPESPPVNPRAAIQTYVRRLRQVVGRSAIRTVPLGYSIEVGPDRLDLGVFRGLVERARAATEPTERAELLGAALELWRDQPLADVTAESVLRDQVPRLVEERLEALEQLMEARLQLGQHAAVIAELTALTREQPLRERFWAQLMLALYRSGRQAEALAAYHAVSRQLAEQLGIDPGAELRQLHQAALTADPQLAAPTPAPPTPPVSVVPRQLPAPPRLFTGRERELTTLTDALDPGACAAEAVPIVAIGGAGGVGKTWLALHWAHDNADRFPDGQLYVNLRGFDPNDEPVPPSVAVRGFLHALGVDAGGIPADLDAQTALYRSLTADRRMLIVLDNADDVAQVTPLLPGSPSCSVLITSRNQLTTLMVTQGAVCSNLDVLDGDDARDLLTGHLGRARIDAEPEAVAELLGWCAGLPLALAIVAARAAVNPDLALAALAAELRDTSTRLDALDVGDLTVNLRAVLACSHRTLDHDAALVFALLGLAPGPDIGVAAVANLAALPASRTHRLLRGLEAAHLVDHNGADRYRMHDLIWAYAAEQARESLPAKVRDAVLLRLVHFYLHTAHRGDRLLYPHRQELDIGEPVAGCGPLPLAGEAAALTWFEAEYDCLVAASQLAADRGWHRAVLHLAWAMDTFRWRQGLLDDNVTAWRAALDAALALGDPTELARAHRLLGDACSRAGLHAEANEHLLHAIALAERTGDHRSEAHAHYALANLWSQRGDARLALTHAGSALDRYRALGNPAWEAMALSAVGWYHAQLGQHRRAGAFCRQALVLHRRHGNREGEAATLDSLGYIAHQSGEHADAVRHYDDALALYRELSNAYEEADTLHRLAENCLALGRFDQARTAWRQALDLYRSQDRDVEARRVEQRMAALSARLTSLVWHRAAALGDPAVR